MSMPAWTALPALAAGNTVILKPSEETPHAVSTEIAADSPQTHSFTG
jgi:acyl-CoA reductase-like NAD-dependent aldehyde dehydrogenase